LVSGRDGKWFQEETWEGLRPWLEKPTGGAEKGRKHNLGGHKEGKLPGKRKLKEEGIFTFGQLIRKRL